MNNKTFKWVTRTLNMMMMVLMAVGALALLLLPKWVKWYTSLDLTFYIYDSKGLYVYILCILYLSGIGAILILNELRKIMKTCALENPFIEENVTSLKRISALTGFIALLYMTKIFIINSFFTMLFVFSFLMATLLCFVLSELFRHAVMYKQENDLTI